jgi:hypothetical protein
LHRSTFLLEMPNVALMVQLSRPYQIALGALALFAIVWLLALRGHSSSTSEPSASPPTPSQPSPTTSVYHGSAPGVTGLTRDLAKAHGAVGASEQNAKQLEQRSAQASGGTVSGTPTATSAPRAGAPTTSSAAKAAAPAVRSPSAAASPAAPKTGNRSSAGPVPGVSTPTMQAQVEGELKQGKIVTVLFWNPKAADDVAVNGQLRSASGRLHGAVSVHVALASEAGSFGSIIRGVQVYGTPTIMIINKHGRAQTLTGYTDAYSIEQAIEEVRHA